MEVLSQVQNVVMEHAFMIGIGLLVVAVVAAIAWFWMSRSTQKSSPVLENQARVNNVEMDIPVSASSSEPMPSPELPAQPDSDDN